VTRAAHDRAGTRDRKRLYLLRHAKSSWDDPDVADHERPLAPRGRRAAKAMARHLEREGVAPALVLCSSSRRTRETLDRIAGGLAAEPEALVEGDLYAAGAGDLLARLRALPDDVESVMLIGHNPGIEELALRLAGAGADRDRMASKFPTGALATLTFEGSWRGLAPGAASLTGFVRPRDLERR
jgi:phosphohistidine phosphatase